MRSLSPINLTAPFNPREGWCDVVMGEKGFSIKESRFERKINQSRDYSGVETHELAGSYISGRDRKRITVPQ
ncbi:MAG: hypothetical protein N5P05_003276 [Chroococcopsis gigantea SAG 12.99]|jgi:hypothetical protein|nr:hypothetical protein [Chroococcopsis gigantea SAG 12.99]